MSHIVASRSNQIQDRMWEMRRKDLIKCLTDTVPLMRWCFLFRHSLSISAISLLLLEMILVSVSSKKFFWSARNLFSYEHRKTWSEGGCGCSKPAQSQKYEEPERLLNQDLPHSSSYLGRNSSSALRTLYAGSWAAYQLIVLPKFIQGRHIFRKG